VPTDRKPLHRAHRSRLDGDAEMELHLGPGHRGSVFENEAQRQWAWTQHRDRLMQQYARGGKRPWAWWRYEAQVPHPGDRQASTLYEMGQLGDEERHELEHWWREQYLRAWDPHFFHCEGPGRFFHGAPARRRHFAWADIPAEFVKQWSAEYRRRRRTIRQLAETVTATEQPAPAA
jgi:hypothetical protein